jgi:hypothetical protein
MGESPERFGYQARCEVLIESFVSRRIATLKARDKVTSSEARLRGQQRKSRRLYPQINRLVNKKVCPQQKREKGGVLNLSLLISAYVSPRSASWRASPACHQSKHLC